MNLRIFIIFFTSLFSLANHNFLYANVTVGAVWKAENLTLPQGRIAYIDPSKGTIFEVNLDGVVTWKYQIPDQYQQKGNMRKGADIEWINKSDHFLFVVPEGGIYEVNRKKEIVWSYETDLVSHDADRLPNGNTIFVNAWDRKEDYQVVEITNDGKKIFTWKISDSGVSCAHETADCYRPKRRGGPPGDYTHVNAVQKFEDGSFLVSLRNLHKVVLIDKTLKVIERHRRVRAVHDPRFEGGKLIAIGRKQGLISRERKSTSSNEDNSYVFRYRNQGYTFLRTNERISDDLILLTDSKHLLIFNQNSKEIVWKLELSGFGDQREEKHLPFVFKAAWIRTK